jgi:hypothetical protein
MKMKILTIVMLAGLFLAGCSDDDGPYVCSSCSDSPDALAVNDASGKGIYKGVVIGSSGTIILDIANSDATITGVLVIDDEEIELTADGVFDGGFEGYLYGTISSENDVSIGFYTNSTGSEYEIWSVTIPGHPDAFVGVIKEYSDQLVEIFEGTYSGDESGTFNMVVLRDDDSGEWYAATDGETFFEGEIDGGEVVGIDDDQQIVIAGTLSGDSASGQWEDISGGTGSWKAKRTL